MNEEALISHGAGHMADKLDGSMIASFMQNGDLFFHTKGGVSSQAKAALDEAPINVREAAQEAFREGATPAFEWTSPENRIVVAYDTSEMTLLAVRNRTTGIYDEDLANHLAAKYDLRQPKIHGRAETLEELKDLISWLRQQDDMEGAVWIGPNGLRSKVKTMSYMKVHKTLSMLSVERHAFRAVVDEMDDDILPLLLPKQRDIWLNYAGAMRARFIDLGEEARAYYTKVEGLDPKEAAQFINANAPASLKTLIFGIKSGRDPVDLIKNVLSKNVGSDTKVQNVKSTYNLPDWDHQGAFMQDT
jgi:RNA ligase